MSAENKAAPAEAKPLFDNGKDHDKSMPPNTVHGGKHKFHVGQGVKTSKGEGKVIAHKDGVYTVQHAATTDFKEGDLTALALPDAE